MQITLSYSKLALVLPRLKYNGDRSNCSISTAANCIHYANKDGVSIALSIYRGCPRIISQAETCKFLVAAEIQNSFTTLHYEA